MAIINSTNREEFIKSMVRHFKETVEEDELRNRIDKDPTILEDYAEWRVNEADYE